METAKRRTLLALALGTIVLALGASAGCPAGEKDYARRRESMVSSQIVARGVRDGRFIAALRKVPRHRFVPPELRGAARCSRSGPVRATAAILDTLGYRNVRVRVGDGFFGWPAHAPFDGIIVTAAAPRVPEPLVEQLAIGGRVVIPVGGRYQDLEICEKTGAGLVLLSTVPVRFVPMTGKVREAE